MCCSDYWTAKVRSPAVPLTISIAAGERLTNYAQVAVGHNPQSVRFMTNYIYSWESHRIYVPECHAVARSRLILEFWLVLWSLVSVLPLIISSDE